MGFRNYHASISFWGLPFNPLQDIIYGKGPHLIRISLNGHKAWHTGAIPWIFVETVTTMCTQRGHKSEKALEARRKMARVPLLFLSLTEQPPFPVMGYVMQHGQVSGKHLWAGKPSSIPQVISIFGAKINSCSSCGGMEGGTFDFYSGPIKTTCVGKQCFCLSSQQGDDWTWMQIYESPSMTTWWGLKTPRTRGMISGHEAPGMVIAAAGPLASASNGCRRGMS